MIFRLLFHGNLQRNFEFSLSNLIFRDIAKMCQNLNAKIWNLKVHTRLIHAVHDIVKNWLLAFQQSKGVSIIVVGVGRNVFRAKRNMYEMAGERGKVLLCPSFDDLPGHLDDIVKATCGKLSLLNCFIFRCV